MRAIPDGSVFIFQVAIDVWLAKGSWKVKLGFDKGNNLILIIVPIFLSIRCCIFSHWTNNTIEMQIDKTEISKNAYLLFVCWISK